MALQPLPGSPLTLADQERLSDFLDQAASPTNPDHVRLGLALLRCLDGHPRHPRPAGIPRAVGRLPYTLLPYKVRG